MRKFLLWITERLRVRIISDNGEPYLERYFLFHGLGVRIYLHRFVGSDPERGWHDHPWHWAFSLVLAGWYLESRRDGLRTRTWGNWLSADTFHRVILPSGARDCWTLFVHSEADVKHWGFLGNCRRADLMLWRRYAYAGAPKDKRWERSAPLGRDIRPNF